mgnify:CR=1 FL=1
MIEIMDTTLRDGEQTSGVSFAAHEKLSIAQVLLNDLGVNRVEIASARVSDGEFEAVKRVAAWAARSGNLDKLEVLGFVDGTVSLDWIESAGCRVVNLLCKGSYKHVTEQLRKTPEQHVDDIRTVVLEAAKRKIDVNIYLEDWSNGIKHSPDYVFLVIDALKGLPICRFMLPDTLGVLNPGNTYEYCKMMVDRYPDLRFDFHAHNDYDLAVANVYSAIRAGIKGIHTTVNGLGERAGNAPLSSVLAVIKDQLGEETNLREEKINKASRLVETYSGVHIPPNKPIIGEHVFTQCAGVHADGDSKNNLYCNDLLPERFGRVREYALGKTSGKANIRKNLEALGIDMDEGSMRKVTERIIELGDKKEMVTPEDLPYIISDVLKHETIAQHVKVINYTLNLSQGLKPVAIIAIEVNGKTYEGASTGDGQYDAFVKAIRKIYKEQLGRTFPSLTNYTVNIPPGGHTDALVQTVISWDYNGNILKTQGLDADQMEAAIQATIKMLNLIEDKELNIQNN